jgi:UDP-N-acetylglucosamine 2-epimerase (non-hydrolysing)
MTLHRPYNVDSKNQLTRLINVIEQNTHQFPVTFPVHSRTRVSLESFGIQVNIIKLVDPMGCHEFNFLVKHAKAVITDSGGITEETTVMRVPCMTLRNTTERPETCTIGTNELIGTKPEDLEAALKNLFAGNWKKGFIPPLWDGKTATRIVDRLLEIKY